MSGSANLPAPYRGIAQDVPQAAIQSPFCYKLMNFNTTNQGIALRNGDTSFSNTTVANLGSTLVFGQYGDTALFAMIYDTATTEMKVYNCETDALVWTGGALGFIQYHPQFFNKYLFFFTTSVVAGPGIYWNGTIWGNVGYTGSGFIPRTGGNNYNHRNYIIQDGECAYWYSEIDAISGALTKVDLSGIVDQLTTLANVAQITLSDQVSTITLQCFCMADGQILFYSGSYPDGNDWQLAGKAKVGQLVSLYDSVFSYQGDAIILSDSGIASLRDLFLKGSQSATLLALSRPAQETWNFLIKSARAGTPSGPLSAAIKGVWDSLNSRVYVVLPYFYSPYNASSFTNNGNFFFVFDALRDAWTFHSSTWPGVGMVPSHFFYYKNKKLYTPSGTTSIVVLEKEGSTGFMDRNATDSADVSYDFDLVTAPIPLPKTGVSSISGVEPIIESDLYAQTSYKFIADLGRQTTEVQIVEDQGTSIAKPLANVGLQQSTMAQLQISGSTVTGKTVGLKLYNFNIWYDSGERGSR